MHKTVSKIYFRVACGDLIFSFSQARTSLVVPKGRRNSASRLKILAQNFIFFLNLLSKYFVVFFLIDHYSFYCIFTAPLSYQGNLRNIVSIPWEQLLTYGSYSMGSRIPLNSDSVWGGGGSYPQMPRGCGEKDKFLKEVQRLKGYKPLSQRPWFEFHVNL